MLNTLPYDDIKKMETTRKRNVKLVYIVWAIIWVAVTFGIYKIVSTISHGTHLVVLTGALGCFICYAAFRFFDSDYRKSLKQTFMQQLADANNLHYSIDGVFDLLSTHKHKILPTYDLSCIEDGFEGQINDIPFAIQEVSLENIDKDRKGRKRITQVFKGLIIRLSLSQTLEFHTIALPRSPIMTWLKTNTSWHTRDFKKVGLSPKFEKKFDVISTDQIESRVIFDPAFMERFLELCEKIKAQSFSASFYKDELLIMASSRKDHFELGHVFKPLNTVDFAAVMEDLEILRDIIDILKLNANRNL